MALLQRRYLPLHEVSNDKVPVGSLNIIFS